MDIFDHILSSSLYMRKKDILELKKRLKKDHCTFTKMCGCYVNGEKNIIKNFRETFLKIGRAHV